jgi:hypothetical protein
MLEQERYAVVSCHVERPLDDRTWRLFSGLQEAMPRGFRIAALLRPPDAAAGEEAGPWLERAREAAARGPLGHHTHWGGAAQARPRDGSPPEQVLREGSWLTESGLAPVAFCGGGWYMDGGVAAAAAQLGYMDCTATAFRPEYLEETDARLAVSEPCWLELPGGERLLELPTTHSLGMLARACLLPGGLGEPLVHAYFHDTDLLDRRRRGALRVSLNLLSRRRRAADLDEVRLAASQAELPVRPVFGR